MRGWASRSAARGTSQARRPILTGAVEFDPNNVLTSWAEVHNGIRFVLGNSAALRDLPNTGATLAVPLLPFVDGSNRTLLDAANSRIGVLGLERSLPLTAPSLIRVWLGFGNAADPNLASSGMVWGMDYPTVSGTIPRRRSFNARVSAVGTWLPATLPDGTTGAQTGMLGFNGSCRPYGEISLDEQATLPVTADGRIGPRGTNESVQASQYVPAAGVSWTHLYLGVGWTGTSTDGIAITWDPYVTLADMVPA